MPNLVGSLCLLPVKLGKLFNIIITFNLMPRTFKSFFRTAQQRNVLLSRMSVVEKERDDPHTRTMEHTLLGYTDAFVEPGDRK